VHEAPPPPDAQAERDTADSPFGMPWQRTEPARGPIAMLVRGMFMLLEGAILVVLLPVRAISAFVGRGAVWVFRLPFRILGLAARLLLLLLAAGVLLLIVVGLLSLMGA
jgi:hypothetical protein